MSTSNGRTTPTRRCTGSIAHTGRPIVAAAGIMIAVFYTFAIAGTLPMKEMGIILGTAVLLDAFVVRLVLVPAVLYMIGTEGMVAAALGRSDAARRPVRPLTRRPRIRKGPGVADTRPLRTSRADQVQPIRTSSTSAQFRRWSRKVVT